MQPLSILVGVITGFVATALVLSVLGLAGLPVHVVLIAAAAAIGIVVGVIAARRVEARGKALAGS